MKKSKLKPIIAEIVDVLEKYNLKDAELKLLTYDVDSDDICNFELKVNLDERYSH